MTVINHKSISGITSITAPAGSDNLLTVHTNDTTERFRIVDSGAIVTGVTTASNFKTGTTNVHNVGVELAGINVLGADTPIGTGATIYNSGAAVFTGVVTATEYRGGGSTGIKVTSTGKVGVGTASPDFIQHNYHATDNVLALFESGDAAALISFQDNSSSDNTQVWLGAQTNDFRLAAGGNERLRIDSSGFMGLGTNSPSSYNNKAYNFVIAGSGHAGMTIAGGTSSDSSIYFADGTSGAAQYAGWVQYEHDNNALTFGVNTSERVRIDSSGYVKLSGRNVQGSANGDKLLRIYQPSRTDAEEDVLLLQSYNQSSTNSIIIGGGDSSFNAATDITFRTAAINTTSGTEKLSINSDGNVYFSGNQSGNNRGIIYNSAGGFGFYASANSSTDRSIKFYSNNTGASQRLCITSTGQLQQDGTSGLSYFKGSSEYIFGSTLSSPPAGGSEANVQIHSYKTRAHFSINGYMNNAGGPFMQFVSSRSGTLGTLGTKCQNNDYLGEIRFMGDNGTNYNSLCQGASIYAQAASTPADGDTTIAGEIYFSTGTASGGSQPVRLCIDSAGRLTMNESNIAANAKALRIKADNDTTSTASSDRTGSNSYKNSAIVIQKGISNGGLVAGLIDAWDTAIHATSIGIIYTSGRYHTSFGVNNDTNDRPVEIMTISGNKTVKIGGGIAAIPADIGLEIGGDGATTEIRLKNSGGGTGASDGFAIQKWSNGNNYIYDYDSNHILFGTGNLSRTRMDTSGRWCFSPSGAITSGSNGFTMSLIHAGNSGSSGIYPGLAIKSTATGGGDGMVIHAFDGSWDLYTKSGTDGISIANDAMNASSANSRVCIGGDGVITMGKTVNGHLDTSRYCHSVLHLSGGALSIGGVGNSTSAHRGGVYTLGWYITQHSNSNYYHIKTDLWAGGSPHGNNEYIMGGFRIEGYSYSSPTGSATAWVQFHNWSGSYPGLSIKTHYAGWNMGATVYTSSDGYVVLRVDGGTYKSHVIDIIQHVHYPSRNIGVASFAQNNNATHF